MMVDQLSDLLGTATGGDVALRTWPVLMERSYEAKNPSNAARSFTTVPIGAPCSQDTLPCPNTASSAATTHIVEIMIEPAAAKAHTIFIDYSIGADASIGELRPSLSVSDLGDTARLAKLSPLGNSICAKLTASAGRTLAQRALQSKGDIIIQARNVHE